MKKNYLQRLSLLVLISLSVSESVAEVIDAKGSGNWSYLNITDNVDPNVADTDFNTTWYNPTTGGYTGATYNGPAFAAGAASPLHYGGVSGLSGGTVLTRPASGSRKTAYFYKVVDGGATGFSNLELSVLADDGAFIYLNGVLIARYNVSDSDTFNKLADSSGDESNYAKMNLIGTPTLNPGANLLAISVHQRSSGSSDLGFDLELTNEGSAFPRGPYLQSASHDRMTVRWRTDSVSNTIIHYGDAPNNLTQTQTINESVLDHVITLTGLTAGTKYYYRVQSGSDTVGADADHYFKTYPVAGAKAATRIWVIGDSGTTNAGKFAVYDQYRMRTGSAHTDVWLMLGDNAYNSGRDSEFQVAVFDAYPALLRNTVLWSCIGNHESVSSGGAPYLALHTFPKAGECGGVASGSESYYSFDHGNIHFVCIDSQLSANKNDALGGNFGMVDWLEQDLQATDKDWIIAYFHHGPYTKGSHNSDTESAHIQMRKFVTPLLEKYGVDMVLSGHSHIYERSMLINGHHSNMVDADSSGSSTFSLATHAIDQGNGSALGSNTALHNGAFQPSGGTGAYQKPLAEGEKGTVYVICGASGKISGTKPGFPHPVFIVNINDKIGTLTLNVDGNTLNAQYFDDSGVMRDDFTILKGTTVEVTATDNSFAEFGADDSATFTVTRTGATDFAEVVDYQISGTATNGVDYAPLLTGSVSFAAGETLKTIKVTRNTDDLAEGNETCTVTLSDAQQAAGTGGAQRDRYFLGGNTNGSATLADNPSQQLWFEAHGAGGVNESDWPLDPGNDGLNNSLEYALGGADGVDGSLLLPILDLTSSNLSLLYNTNNALTDIIYKVTTSTQIQGWSQSGVVDTLNGAANPNGVEQRKTSYSTIANEPKRFMRLEVIRQ